MQNKIKNLNISVARASKFRFRIEKTFPLSISLQSLKIGDSLIKSLM